MRERGRDGSATRRFRDAPWRLVRDAAGLRDDLARRAKHLASAIAAYREGGRIDAEIERLYYARGVIDVRPTRIQVLVGGFDMLRRFIAPAAADSSQRRRASSAC